MCSYANVTQFLVAADTVHTETTNRGTAIADHRMSVG